MRSEQRFQYQRESVLGMLDGLSADTQVEVSIPQHGEKIMTVEELRRLIETLRAGDVGKGAAMEQLKVQVLAEPKKAA